MSILREEGAPMKTAFGDSEARSPALLDPRSDYACRCVALDHDHRWGTSCDRRTTFAGGVCIECRYFHVFPEGMKNLLDLMDAQAESWSDHRTRCHDYDPDSTIEYLHSEYDKAEVTIARLRKIEEAAWAYFEWDDSPLNIATDHRGPQLRDALRAALAEIAKAGGA